MDSIVTPSGGSLWEACARAGGGGVIVLAGGGSLWKGWLHNPDM